MLNFMLWLYGPVSDMSQNKLHLVLSRLIDQQNDVWQTFLYKSHFQTPPSLSKKFVPNTDPMLCQLKSLYIKFLV